MEVFLSICPYLSEIFQGAFGLDEEHGIWALFHNVGDIVMVQDGECGHKICRKLRTGLVREDDVLVGEVVVEVFFTLDIEYLAIWHLA